MVRLDTAASTPLTVHYFTHDSTAVGNVHRHKRLRYQLGHADLHPRPDGHDRARCSCRDNATGRHGGVHHEPLVSPPTPPSRAPPPPPRSSTMTTQTRARRRSRSTTLTVDKADGTANFVVTSTGRAPACVDRLRHQGTGRRSPAQPPIARGQDDVTTSWNTQIHAGRDRQASQRPADQRHSTGRRRGV